MGYPLKRKRIDARATRLDMNGNVISQPGERAFTGISRDMSGEPMGGTNILTGSTVSFPDGKVPEQNATPAKVAQADSGEQSPNQEQTPPKPAFPRSAMTTQTSGVQFKSPQAVAQEQSARTTPTQSIATAMPGWENAGPIQRRMMLRKKAGLPGSEEIIRQQNGAVGAVVNARSDGSKSLASVYGTASIQFPRPGVAPERPAQVQEQFPRSGRIFDNGKDVTSLYAAGGKNSSTPRSTVTPPPDWEPEQQQPAPEPAVAENSAIYPKRRAIY